MAPIPAAEPQDPVPAVAIRILSQPPVDTIRVWLEMRAEVEGFVVRATKGGLKSVKSRQLDRVPPVVPPAGSHSAGHNRTFSDSTTVGGGFTVTGSLCRLNSFCKKVEKGI